jgi:cell division protein FtsI/penicillin-binding protein 2
LNDYVSPPNRGPGKKPPGSPKLKIPQKGRIRVALAVILLTVAVVKFAGPCGRGVNTVNKVNSVDSVGNVNKDSGVDNAKKNNAAGAVNSPGNGITFIELRSLVKEYGIDINTSRRQIVIPAADENNKRLFSRGKGKDGDTLSVSLSVDTTLQKYASSMFRRYRPRYAAAAAVDPSTGRVLALASYANEGEALDGRWLCLKNRFPAASVFKTVVAAAAIEKGGMHGKTTIEHFGRNHTLYTTQLRKELKVSRDITLEDAYAYSINPVFARIALFNVNKDIVFEYGRRFGFNEPVPFEYDVDVSEMFSPDTGFSVAEFASGFNRKTTITPLFGALLAGAVCGNGIIYEPTVIDTVRSVKGDSCLYARRTKVWRRAVKEQTAAELRGLMGKVTHYGTARNTFRQLRDSPRYNAFEFGGKTGTVNQVGLGRVDWFVGFARNPTNMNQRIAVGVVTTHGDYWTVHSSYIAAELIKKYISNANP